MRAALIVIIAVLYLGAKPSYIDVTPTVSAPVLVGKSADFWQLSPLMGLRGGLPVVDLPFTLELAFQGGRLRARDGSKELKVVLTTFGIVYEVPLRHGFMVAPMVGGTNLLYLDEAGFDATKPFAGDSENESGLAGGIGLRYSQGRFLAGFEPSARTIFSRPNTCSMLLFSLYAGVRF